MESQTCHEFELDGTRDRRERVERSLWSNGITGKIKEGGKKEVGSYRGCRKDPPLHKLHLPWVAGDRQIRTS